jgi:hypothetical protein
MVSAQLAQVMPSIFQLTFSILKSGIFYFKVTIRQSLSAYKIRPIFAAFVQ